MGRSRSRCATTRPTRSSAPRRRGGTASYRYDAAGNLLSDGASAYRYDALDRLTALAGAGTTEGYGYTGDGVLVTQTVNGAPTTYTQDLAAGQSQVLQTATGTGTPAVTDYLYGDGAERLASLAALPTGGTARTWYGADPQGSVRYTTDDGANVSPTVNYDPYGQPEGGAVPPTFGYNGEVQDAATGLVNLRARTYNPATGQFLTRDPLEAQTAESYAYAEGDPVNGTDPSGTCTVFGVEISFLGIKGSSCRQQALGQTNQNISQAVLSPDASPIYYPTITDKNCLYAQAERDPAIRPLLRHGFDIGPIKRVDTQGGPVVAEAAVAGRGSVLEEAAQVAERAAGQLAIRAGVTVLGVLALRAAAVIGGVAAIYVLKAPDATTATTGDEVLAYENSLQRRRDRNIPTVYFSFGRAPEISVPAIALNIGTAQLAGKPYRLTYLGTSVDPVTGNFYGPGSQAAQANRSAACSGSRQRSLFGRVGTRANGLSCDEYPFASTVEGGFNTQIMLVPARENSRQGGILSGFYNGRLRASGQPLFYVQVVP